MTGREVIESFDNAWRALCGQYRKNPDGELQRSLNFLGKIIGIVKTEVEKTDEVKQITVDDWIEMLERGI